jgi:3-methylcrotonyl-CoA carboxylase alpha subunit
MITGQDFVEWQLLVASGFPLPKKQSEIEKKGTSIEVRIYSEDPFNGFLPNHGKLKYFKEPVESEGVRI